MKKKNKKLEIAVNEFLLPLQRLDFDENASYAYAQIRPHLESQGLFIAAHAKSLKAVLVTNNTREFERVEDLKIEDWTKN
jgi:tRNA(fMet)-specific endonuclease VapC